MSLLGDEIRRKVWAGETTAEEELAKQSQLWVGLINTEADSDAINSAEELMNEIKQHICHKYMWDAGYEWSENGWVKREE